MRVPRADFDYRVVDGAVLIRDHDGAVSVTNDAESVVASVMRHIKSPADRILYRDTVGDWSELKHDGREFTGFAPINDNDRQKFNLQ